MKTIFTFLFSIAIFAGAAQNKLADRIYFGGGLGFSTNSNQTNISLSPQVGYKITERYSAGVGVLYQYVHLKQIDASLNNYGWSLFNRFNVTEQFFAYTEFERLSFEYFTTNSFEEKDRIGFNSFFIGGGYTERLSRSASFSVTALYNVLYNPNESSPYDSPLVIRAGLGVGLF